MSGIFNRLELDVMQANELSDSIELAMKHNFPAIVVHPGLSSDAIRMRGRFGGRFRIITPVDWPKGDNFGSIKMRGLSTDALEADGFEICLTGGKDEGATRNEAKALTEFIRRHIGELVEVRFVLGAFLRDEANILSMCRGLVGVRVPTFIRTDTQLKLQVSKANTEAHNLLMDSIRGIIRAPIKISGNITSVRSVTGSPDASRFAVNLAQARGIIKEFTQQPGELKTILDATPAASVPSEGSTDEGPPPV